MRKNAARPQRATKTSAKTSAKRAAKTAAKTNGKTAQRSRSVKQLDNVKLGDMTPDEQQRVVTHATKRLTKELQQHAPAIVAILNDGVDESQRASTLQQYISAQPDAKRAALYRHLGKLQRNAETFATISDARLFATYKGIGGDATAQLLSVDVKHVRERLVAAQLIGSGSMREQRPRTIRTTSGSVTIERGNPIVEQLTSRDRTLIDDIASAVRVDTLAVGALCKTPDSPREGLAGQVFTLLRLGTGSASVRVMGTRRVEIKGDNGETLADFDAPGRRIEIGLSTMVVPLDEKIAQAAAERGLLCTNVLSNPDAQIAVRHAR